MKILRIHEYEVLLDDEDYQRVVDVARYYKRKWCVIRYNGKIRSVHLALGCEFSRYHLILSRFIMNYFGELVIDHINRNTLDNQKANLRIVTKSVNALNVEPRKRK